MALPIRTTIEHPDLRRGPSHPWVSPVFDDPTSLPKAQDETDPVWVPIHASDLGAKLRSSRDHFSQLPGADACTKIERRDFCTVSNSCAAAKSYYQTSVLIREHRFLVRIGAEGNNRRPPIPFPSSGCYLTHCHSFNCSLWLSFPLRKGRAGQPNLSFLLRYRSLSRHRTFKHGCGRGRRKGR